MAKPSTVPTWASDANIGSGPAAGNPTKVDPAGWPAVVQGFVPGDSVIATYVNKILNAICDEWIAWVNAGSSAGAADAHIVETTAAGATTLRRVTTTGDGGGFIYRGDGTIANSDTSIDAATKDTWTCAEPTAERIHTLLDSTATTALVNGMRTTVKRGADGAFVINIRREAAGANEYMAVLTSAQHTSATFQVEGGRWVLHTSAPNCTAGPDAGP